MSLIIDYKEFIQNPNILFNYNHNQIKINTSKYYINNVNHISLSYIKDKKYDNFIIEATNDDIEFFESNSYKHAIIILPIQYRIIK